MVGRCYDLRARIDVKSGYMYVCTYVCRSSAQARTSRRSLRRRRRLDMYSGRNVTRVCVHMHACVRGVPRVCVCMHACVDWYGLEMVGTYVRTYVDVDHGRREAKYARAHS